MKYFRYMDFVAHAFVGPDLVIDHRCDSMPKPKTLATNHINRYIASSQTDNKEESWPNTQNDQYFLASDMLEDVANQELRNANNRVLSRHIKGNFMQCKHCKKKFSSGDLVDSSL